MITRIYSSERAASPKLQGLRACLVALLVSSGVLAPPAVANQPFAPAQDDVLEWLTASRLPAPAKEALAVRRSLDPQANEWLAEQDGLVYALTTVPFQPDTPGAIRVAKTGMAETQARQALLRYAAGEHFARLGYTQREAVAKALMQLDSKTKGRFLPGVQSRATALQNQAVALFWTDARAIQTLRQQPPAKDQFLPAYCVALYPTAQALFLQREYAEALRLFREMQALNCPRPLAYFLDAADCFLALGQSQDAARMAEYLLDQPHTELSSELAERAGDILYSAGKEKQAESAYVLALDLLKTPAQTVPKP